MCTEAAVLAAPRQLGTGCRSPIGLPRLSAPCPYAGGVTVLHVPDDLAARLAAEAAKRGVDVEELSAELLRAGLSGDSLEEFIGAGRSGLSDLARKHREVKAEVSGHLSARDL